MTDRTVTVIVPPRPTVDVMTQERPSVSIGLGQGEPGKDGTLDGGWHPKDHGLLAWAYDPCLVSAQAAAGQGQMILTRLKLPEDAYVTGVVVYVIASGATLTTDQCFAALYDAESGAMIGSSADEAAAWQSTGGKFIPLIGGPYSLSAGDFYVGHYSRGTTLPQFGRVSSAAALVNLNLTGTDLRFATSTDTYTTAPPSTLGVYGAAASYWAAMY